MQIKKIKEVLKKLSSVGLEINFALDSGISFAGINVSKARMSYAERSKYALDKCILLKPKSVLDVGSGGGEHALEFSKNGAAVTCVDFGTSIYAKRLKKSTLDVINVDFLKWNFNQKFDLVWASHILEHQRNVGIFIEKLVSFCKPDGKCAITVPYPHRALWGGHLTHWSPGLLAYNIILCGLDLSRSEIFYGYREISIIFTPERILLPDITFDSGDIEILRNYFPKGLGENIDAWI